MLASARGLAICLAAVLLVSAAPGDAVAQTKPASEARSTAKTAAAKKKPAAKPARVAPRPAPVPPPAVELIGMVTMPADAFRGGPAAGRFNDEGRRAGTPRFESQPVQGVSSIKPGPTPGAWWALSDNGFGKKWNSADYRLCIYLFELRPRTGPGTDSRNALQGVIDLSDPAKFFPWRIADENDPERILTGSDADPESLVVMPDGTYWVGDEFGPWLLHFSEDGELLAAPVELPEIVFAPEHPLVLSHLLRPRLPSSRGFEAMDVAGDGRTLVTILEGGVAGDAPKSLRLQRYDTVAAKWLPGTLIYTLDPDTTSVTEISLIDGNRFVVVERDDKEGDAAKAKRVYAIDLDKALAVKATAARPLEKKLVIDLLNIGNARGIAEALPPGTPFRFPYLTTESIQVLDRTHVVVVNDNNFPAKGGRGPGITDATEWIWLELATPL